VLAGMSGSAVWIHDMEVLADLSSRSIAGGWRSSSAGAPVIGVGGEIFVGDFPNKGR
jgi:hypothetical protein